MKKGISKFCLSGLILLFIVGFNSSLKAQNATDVLRYSLQYPSYDPVTMVMPGVAKATGFGAYQENPAVMALFDHSFVSGGLSDIYVTEKGQYLKNSSSFDVNSLGISHAGFLYQFPTSRGSLVIGGGYSQTTGYNRALTGFGFNDQTTLTDFYAGLPEGDLYFAAYDAYTIYEKNFPDNTYLPVSILRAPSINEYQGINQRFEITEKGAMGEYSAFVATELFEDFFVGASIGAIAGNYSYKRNFTESDKQGLYNGARLEIDNDARPDTDVDHIISENAIRDSFTGFSARLGILYQVTSDINIGVSYQFPNVLFVDRETDVFITTSLDNMKDVYEGKVLTKFNYKVTRPDRLTLGFAVKDMAGFSFSAMAERVRYSSAEIEFDGFSDLDNNGTSDDIDINSSIKNNYKNIINLRFGLEYQFNGNFTPRIGYGYYPSPLEDSLIPKGIDTDRQFFSGGFTAQISKRSVLNVGVQYSTWEQTRILYVTDIGTSEIVDEQVHRWNIMAGLTYYF